MTFADDARDRSTSFAALAAALESGHDDGTGSPDHDVHCPDHDVRRPDHDVRCPDCDVRYLDEVWAGVWECERCGRVENPRSTVETACPYCGQPPLGLCWEEEIVECASCGVVDKADVRAVLPR